jgi:type I restriction enzyme S subunit
VIADLKPYAEYKESGLAWLGHVPSSWRVVRNGSLFGQRNQTGYGELPILEVSLKTAVRVRDFQDSTRKQVMSDFGKYKRAAKGDVAYNMMRMWQGAVGVSPVDGLVSPAYVVARPYPQVDPRFFVALFRTGDYMSEIDNCSRGIVKDRNRLYWDQFKQILSPCPPPDEQAAIVQFLNWASGRLERAIRANRKVISLLDEQKPAIIHRAVTRGLEPSTPVKPSGIAWLGEIPQHWNVPRFKTRIGFQEGPGIMLSDFREAGVPLLRISCLADVEATLKGCNYLSPAKVRERWSHFAVRRGDYLLSASGSTGAVRRASEEVVGAIPYTGIIRLWPKSDALDMEYLRLFMSAKPFADQISLAKSGVGIEHFGPTHLKRMWICQPPMKEQRAIVEHVRSAIAGLDTASARLERQIDLLREFRTRIVADVVTGKLDVREAAAQVPEEGTPETADDDIDLGIDPEAADDEAAV